MCIVLWAVSEPWRVLLFVTKNLHNNTVHGSETAYNTTETQFSCGKMLNHINRLNSKGKKVKWHISSCLGIHLLHITKFSSTGDKGTVWPNISVMSLGSRVQAEIEYHVLKTIFITMLVCPNVSASKVLSIK